MTTSDSSSGIALRLVEKPAGEFSLDEIYRRYCRYVAAVVLRLDGRNAEVEDLVQDVFEVTAEAGRSLFTAEAQSESTTVLAVGGTWVAISLGGAFMP